MSLCRLPGFRGALLAASVWLIAAPLPRAAADDSPQPRDDAAEAAEFREYAQSAAGTYDLRLGREEDRKLVLGAGSILRWTNPVGGHQAHGEVFLWTDRGRPEAVLSLYQVTEANGVHEHHEFCSLALGPLVARRAGDVAWSPPDAGIVMKKFPEAPAPDDSSRLRLGQMRKLAEQLKADKTTRQDVVRELRLLAKPVHRYGGEHPEIVDGALFAFVEATDPEAFLLLEARAGEEGQGHVWQYGLVRMNSVRLRVFHGDRLLWEAPTLPWSDALDRADKPYTALRIR